MSRKSCVTVLCVTVLLDWALAGAPPAQTPTATPDPEQFDLSGDGIVDATDLLLFVNSWQARTTPLVSPTLTPTETATATSTPTPTQPNAGGGWRDGIIGTIATGSATSLMTGDDGYYLKGHPHSYTDHGNGTVTDNNTGLMWIQDATAAGVGGTYNWAEALSACANLTYAGHSDWRLPTIQELSTLRDAGRFTPGLDPVFATQLSYYWSATPYAINPEVHSWVMNTYDGAVFWGEFQSSAWYIRPVRTGSANKGVRFTDNGNGTITDANTGLMWVKDPSVTGIGGAANWADAITACEDLNYAGHADWRMPNINELSSLIDYSRNAPAIDPIFLNTSSFSWSSTVVSSLPAQAWEIDFGAGIVDYSNRNVTGFVRPVRDNQR